MAHRIVKVSSETPAAPRMSVSTCAPAVVGHFAENGHKAKEIAWTAFQHLHRAPNRRVAWHWYDKCPVPCDVHGGPIAL